jgi:hypothetical protein
MDEENSGPKNEAGKDLVRAIFGTDALAGNSLQLQEPRKALR